MSEMVYNKKEKIKKYYEDEADIYDYTHGAGMYGAQRGIEKYYFKFFKQYIKPGAKVLEVGCGTGVFTQALMRISKSIISSDISDNMLQEAKKRNPGVKFKIADIEDLPFEDEKFDFVVAVNSFSYVPDKKKGIAEIKRVLKKNGKFLLVDMNLLCPAYYFTNLLKIRQRKIWFSTIMDSNRFYLSNLLKDNQFKVIKIYEGNLVPHRATKKNVKFYLPLEYLLKIFPFFNIITMRIFVVGEKE